MHAAARHALELLDDHGPRLHRLLYRITLREDAAEDLLQELFLRLSRGDGLARADDPLAYALATATRLAFDWRRSQRRRRDAARLDAHEPALDGAVGDRLDRREDLQRVLQAIEGLPPTLRRVVVIRYLENRPYDEVAALVNKSPHHVRALCHKAIVRLRRLVAVRNAHEFRSPSQ